MSSSDVLRVADGPGSLDRAPCWVLFAAAASDKGVRGATSGTDGAAGVGAATCSSVSISTVPSGVLWASGGETLDVALLPTNAVATATTAGLAGGVVAGWAA